MPGPVYAIEEIVEAAPGWFGVHREDVLGAFYGRAGSYTQAEAGAIIAAWLGTPYHQNDYAPATPRKLAILADVPVGPEGDVPVSRGGEVVWEAVAGVGGGQLPSLTADTGDPFRVIMLSNGTVKAIPLATPVPTAAGGLAGVIKLTSVTLSWTAGTGVGIRYAILKDGAEVAQVSQLVYKDPAVAAGGTYSYRVQTVDTYGQRSAPTALFSAFVNPAINQSPAVSVLTWPPAGGGYPAYGRTKVRVDAADPDAQSLVLALTADGGTLVPDPGPDNDPSVWWWSP